MPKDAYSVQPVVYGSTQAMHRARLAGVVIRDFAYGEDSRTSTSTEELGDGYAVLALLAAVEEQWISATRRQACEPSAPVSEASGDILIGRDDGEVYIDPRDISPGPWICLEDDLTGQWLPYDAFMIIQPTGMDITPLTKLWEEGIKPIIMPGRTLAPMVYDGRQCMFGDLRDYANALTEWIGVQNLWCPDQQAYNGTLTGSFFALQHYLNELGKMAAQRAYVDGRLSHCRKSNYVELSTPLTLVRFKSNLLTMFAKQTKEHSNARAKLRLRKLKAEMNKDKQGIIEVARQRRRLNQQMFDEAADRVAANLSVPLVLRQNQCVAELESLYALYETQRVLLMHEDFDMLQAVDALERLQQRMRLHLFTGADVVERHIDMLDHRLSSCGALAGKAAVRMSRICATDIVDKAERSKVGNGRLQTTKGLEMLLAVQIELADVGGILTLSKDSVDEVQSFFETLIQPVLDAYVLLRDLDSGMEIQHGVASEARLSTVSDDCETTLFERHKTGALSTIDEESISSK